MEKLLRFLGLKPRFKVAVHMELPGGCKWAGTAGKFITSRAAEQLRHELVHSAPETVETTATVGVAPI